MDQSQIGEYLASLGGVHVVVSSKENGGPAGTWGDSFFFYDPDDVPESRRLPFATIVTQDYQGFDEASDLDREGVFRLNMWVGKEACRRLFGDSDVSDFDPATLDLVIPHPVYFRQGWVSVLNPSDGSLELTKELLAEAHEGATRRYRPSHDG